MTTRMLKIKEVCAKVRVSEATLRRMIRNGKFPQPKRTSDRSIGWLEGDVDAWMAAL
jgi:prophage regulatory protein